MRESVRRRVHETRLRFRRFERRELRELRRWLETTSNLVHLSILVFVPLLIGLVTVISNAIAQLSFLLFPPLAAGTFTLFADPEGRYASPGRFVAGLTLGALCGWVALEFVARYLYGVPPVEVQVDALAAALAVFLTGATTWSVDLEEPAAFSTALLVLVTGTSQLSYVISVAAASALVAGAFVVWRDQFYEQRADFLYETVQGDDHVLVPMRGPDRTNTARFAASLAGAHDAGKVVLLAIVAAGEPDGEATAGDDQTSDPTAAAVAALEEEAGRIETRIGVPCEILVATAEGGEVATARRAANEANCDLIVTPYEERHGGLSPFVRGLFRTDFDVIAFRSADGRERWKRVLVPVRRPGDVAHAMLDFALRLAGRTGSVAACHCIGHERERRRAESMLADLVETFSGSIETRVAHGRIENFLAANAAGYDLTIIGASTDRTAPSRFVSPPTFERLQDLPCDVAVVHRG